MRTVIRTILLLVAMAASRTEAQTAFSWQHQVAAIEAQLDESLAAYAAADSAAAKRLAEEAYFASFESEPNNMEVAVRMHISGRRAYDLEAQFTELRQGIRQGAELATLQAARAKLLADLNVAATELDKEMGLNGAAATEVRAAPVNHVSRTDAFAKSLLIILREGFEVILIIGAISAFLVKAGARNKLRIVTSGVVSGLVASVATAVFCMMFVRTLAVDPEIIEGATLLLAAVVLFFVSHWLISKAESQHWVRFIKSKVDVSLSTGNMTALWLASFLAVYREGAETVLFYQGLVAAAPQQAKPILVGFLAGAVGLSILFLTFRRGILRIPPRPFFRVTSALLYYMAFVFAGKAVVELQAGQVLHLAPLRGWPTIEFLGIYPTVQSLVLQALFIAAILVSMTIVFLRRQPEPITA